MQNGKEQGRMHFFMRLAMLMALVAGLLNAEEAKTKVVQTPFGPSVRAADGRGTAPVLDDPKTKVVQTPFGPSVRAEDGRGTARRGPRVDPLLKIEENGDTVTFKRRTPFGEQVWSKKRSELTDLEKEMIEAQRTAPPADDKPGDKR